MVRPYAVASLALAALLGCGREGSGVIAPRITVDPRSTFALGRVGLASDGRRVRVEVSNAGGSTTSREASLSVTAAPSPALILPEVSAMGLAASGLDVYWTDGVRVVGASLDCEGPVRTLFERLDFWTTTVAWMTLAGDQIVWANYLGGDIRATAIDGSATTTLVSNLGVILGVLEDRGSIYWIGSQGIGSTSIWS